MARFEFVKIQLHVHLGFENYFFLEMNWHLSSVGLKL